MAKVLDGAAIAAAIKQEVAEEVQALSPRRASGPDLAAVLVGHVPASEIYVRSKVQTCAELGLFSDLITPPDTVTTEEMLDLVAELNARDDIDGILIQLPLAEAGRCQGSARCRAPGEGRGRLSPCKCRPAAGGPSGSRAMHARGRHRDSQAQQLPISGQHAVVVGRSDIVGKPVAMLLLHENATVTICHSKTRDLGEVTREADILVAAIGRPGFITPEMVKPGATIIDVGINRITTRRSSTVSSPAMRNARPLSPSADRRSSATCTRRRLNWPARTRRFPAAWVR